MDLAIVTGVSSGLGESVATLFLKSNTPLIGISRRSNEDLSDYAQKKDVAYKHFNTDLQDVNNLEKLISMLQEQIVYYQPKTIYLINNAAMVNPVHQASHLKPKELINHINLNLSAPMILMNALLKLATDNTAKLVGLTVSSGAADSPVYGWSAYSSSKAGINMYTKTAALEQEEMNSGHRVIAFNPGIMDTEMQKEIRSHSHDEFSEVDRFKEYKEQNKLRHTDEVASVLHRIVTMKEKLVNGHIYSVSN